MQKTLSAKQDKKEILVIKYIFVFDIVVNISYKWFANEKLP